MDNTNNVMYKGSHKIRSGSRPLPVVKVITMVLLQSPEQEFMVELTDEKDPFFYYTLKLSQEDFLLIKDQQNLTSEFNQFPDQLISLLKKTQQTETRLYIHIDINEQNILLYIREEGTVKHMTHLTLQFKKKPSQEIQDHVIESIKRLTVELKHTKTKYNEVTQQLEVYQERIQNQDKELNRLNEELEERYKDFKNQLTSQRQSLESKMLKAINETEEDYKSQIIALQTLHQQEKEKSYRAESRLELHVDTLNKEKFILKGRLIETSNKYESCRNELQKLQKEIKTLQVRVKDNQENSCKIQLEKRNEMLRRQAMMMNNALKDEIKKRQVMEEKLEKKTSEIQNIIAQNQELAKSLRAAKEQKAHILKNCEQFSCKLKAKNASLNHLQEELRQISVAKCDIEKALVKALENTKCCNEEIDKMKNIIMEKEQKLQHHENKLKENDVTIQNLLSNKLSLQEALSVAVKKSSSGKERIVNSKEGTCAPHMQEENVENYYLTKFLQKRVPDPGNVTSLPSEDDSKPRSDEKTAYAVEDKDKQKPTRATSSYICPVPNEQCSSKSANRKK